MFEIINEFNSSELLNVSQHTYNCRLLYMRLQSRRPNCVPMFKAFGRHERILSARRHVYWAIVKWKMIVWTDEFRYCLRHLVSRVYVKRLPEESFFHGWTDEKKEDDVGSIMVMVIVSWNELVFLYIVKIIFYAWRV